MNEMVWILISFFFGIITIVITQFLTKFFNSSKELREVNRELQPLVRKLKYDINYEIDFGHQVSVDSELKLYMAIQKHEQILVINKLYDYYVPFCYHSKIIGDLVQLCSYQVMGKTSEELENLKIKMTQNDYKKVREKVKNEHKKQIREWEIVRSRLYREAKIIHA